MGLLHWHIYLGCQMSLEQKVAVDDKGNIFRILVLFLFCSIKCQLQVTVERLRTFEGPFQVQCPRKTPQKM